jgi:uncharacterized protein
MRLDKTAAHVLSSLRMRALLLLLPFLAAAAAPDADGHRQAIEAWRGTRLANLTSENGWLTLVALQPLPHGATPFGRAPGRGITLDHPALAKEAGTFTVHAGEVRFSARPGSGITLGGKPVSDVEMQADASGAPTVLSAGSLRLFVIRRENKLYLRVRDLEHPARRQFAGLQYFPVAPEWLVEARFEPYAPAKRIPIMDILGEERPMASPGALVFEKDGRTWRLDAIEEEPGAEQLFVMFADGTSARETYGAGRFLYVSRPMQGRVLVDFNKAYNPPCAFNDFATCPLPPQQNRLGVRVEAGELKYERPGS